MNFKKWTALLLSAIMVCAVVCAAPLTAFAEEETTPVTINKVYLKAGTPLSVDNPSGYALRYFVGGEEREGDVLVPTEADYEKWITVKAYDGEEEVSADKVYFSKLPVLYINTDDGEKITSKTDYKDASLTIQNNTEASTYMYDGATKIRGRGNSSWRWPKKPYLIKLDKKTDLFGMGKKQKVGAAGKLSRRKPAAQHHSLAAVARAGAGNNHGHRVDGRGAKRRICRQLSVVREGGHRQRARGHLQLGG